MRRGSSARWRPELPAYLRSGRVILLLDALNEMPQVGYKERVGRIQALLDQFPDAPVVVTCRALDYVETLRLEKLEVKPLDVDRQREYLHRYLGEAEGEKLFWQLCGGEEIAALWRTWQQAGGTWEQFWTADDIPERRENTPAGPETPICGAPCARMGCRRCWPWGAIPSCW